MDNYQTILNKFPSLVDINKNLSNPELKTKKYFGYHCVFTPEEILHAAGFIPIRMFPTSDSDSYDGKCLHARSCDLARKILENFKDGKFDYLHGSVFTHCCDTLRAVFETLSVKHDDVYYLDTPLSMSSSYGSDQEKAADVDYFSSQFRSFSSMLAEKHNITISDSDIVNSLKIYRKNRELVKKLESSYYQGKISSKDYFTALRSGYCIRKEEHNVLLEELLQALDTEPDQKLNGSRGVPILLAGGINANYSPWIEYLEDLGINIVSDDLCDFARYQVQNEVLDSDPYQQLVLESLEKYCPVKINVKDRFARLYEKYQKSGAKGIIFMIYQYCDIQQIDYSEMKKDFAEKHIPTLILNPTIYFKRSGQVDTRIEAFVEMVELNS